MNDYLKQFERKRLMILGFGREGVSTYHFIRKHFPDKVLLIADKNKQEKLDIELQEILKKDNNLQFFGGESYLGALNKADLVIKTPGIPNKLKEIKQSRVNGVEFTSQTKIFLHLCPSIIVGITGTKGKSTTSSLTNHILKNIGLKSELMGNIGCPPLDYLSEDKDKIYVFEMSSHQLSDLDKSPHIAVFLNIFLEHLDYYENYDDYLSAKANITKYQMKDDFFIYDGDFTVIRKIAENSPAKIINFKETTLPKLNTKLIGIHNIKNIKAAVSVAKIFKLNDDQITDAVKSFTPLDDRLELIANLNGVDYVDDGLATIPQATIAAIEAFGSKIITLVLGGYDRGLEYDSLINKIIKSRNLVNVILTGQIADKLEKSLYKNGYNGKVLNLNNSPMIIVVKKCAEISKPGSIVLLSPAATSFDMYKDYKDRAEQFKKAVLNLKILR